MNIIKMIPGKSMACPYCRISNSVQFDALTLAPDVSDLSDIPPGEGIVVKCRTCLQHTFVVAEVNEQNLIQTETKQIEPAEDQGSERNSLKRIADAMQFFHEYCKKKQEAANGKK